MGPLRCSCSQPWKRACVLLSTRVRLEPQLATSIRIGRSTGGIKGQGRCPTCFLLKSALSALGVGSLRQTMHAGTLAAAWAQACSAADATRPVTPCRRHTVRAISFLPTVRPDMAFFNSGPALCLIKLSGECKFDQLIDTHPKHATSAK